MANKDDDLLLEMAANLSADIDDEPFDPGEKGDPSQTHWMPRLNEPTQVTMFDDPSDIVAGYGPKYTGKCYHPDGQVYTENGLARLRRLSVDSKPGVHPVEHTVIGFDGEKLVPCKTNAHYIEPSPHALEVTLSHGGVIIGSHAHPVWCCIEHAGKATFGYASLSEIDGLRDQGARVFTPLMAHPSFARSDLKTVTFKTGDERKVSDSAIITERLAYALGALCGDGDLNNIGASRQASMSGMDQECLSSTGLGILELGAVLKFRGRCTWGINNGKRLVGLIRELGMDRLSYFKRIPDAIIESPRSVLCAFLSGLFDTDGTVDKRYGSVSLCTTSKWLARDVQWALQALGIVSSIRPKKSASKRPTWNINIYGRHARKFADDVGFAIKRKQDLVLRASTSDRAPNGFNGRAYKYPPSICGAIKRAWLASPVLKGRDRAWHDSIKPLRSSFKYIPCQEKVEAITALIGVSDELRPYLLSHNWVEVVGITPINSPLMDLSVPEHRSFVAGGIINHNTIVFAHKIVRHCWQEWDALFLILGNSYGTLSEGVCHDMTSLVLPTWAEGNREPAYIKHGGVLIPNPRAGELMDEGIGLEYSPWKLDPNNKNLYLKIKNRFGGWSRIRVISSPHPSEVEARVKGPAPSGVYLEEATNCKGKEYFTYPSLQLYRRRDITGPQQFLLSCNPEDPENWVHEWLWKDCVVTEGGRVWPNDPESPGIRRDASVSVYFVPYHENMHNVSQKNREMLEKNLRNDVILRQRLIEGKWVAYPSGEALFKTQFSVGRHIHGDREKQTGLLPVPGYPIVVGYDLGSRHCGISFQQHIPNKDGTMVLVFDELCYYAEKIPFRRLAVGLVEKMRFWNEWLRNRLQTEVKEEDANLYSFYFWHIAADDATNMWSPNKGSTDAKDLEDYSREVIAADPVRYRGIEPIKIRGCPRPAGSIEKRSSLTMDDLTINQIAVSALCPWHEKMFLLLEHDTDNPMEPKPRHRYIHTFDAFSYPRFYRHLKLPGGFIQPDGSAAVNVT